MAPQSRQSDHPADRTVCQRCGTCCRKGGPTLHAQDRRLVEEGLIPLHDLFTIRRGEMAHDHMRGGLRPVAADHIKLKGRGDTWTCRYYDEDRKLCSTYARRPLECRILQCWDTGGIEKIYGRDLLSRKDLLAGVAGLWDLVADHQDRCSYRKARQLMGRLDGRGQAGARRKLLQMIQYDVEIRRLVTRQGAMNAGVLDFLFGRPMSVTLKAEGLNLQPKPR